MTTFVQFKFLSDTTDTIKVAHRNENTLAIPMNAKAFRFIDADDEHPHIINQRPDRYFKDISQWKKIVK